MVAISQEDLNLSAVQKSFGGKQLIIRSQCGNQILEVVVAISRVI